MGPWSGRVIPTQSVSKKQVFGYLALSIFFWAALDYPFVTTLLPNNTIEIHNIETQTIVQVISAPLANDGASPERVALAASLGGYLVPSTQRSEKMKPTRVPLLRTTATS